jgi:RND superfamily putative drug exporter
MQFTSQNPHHSGSGALSRATTTNPRRPGSGVLSRAVSAAARRSARRPRLAIALWLLLIVGCIAAGTLTGTRSLSSAGSGTGESARAYSQMTAAGLQAPAVESVLIRSSTPHATSQAAARLVAALKGVPEAKTVTGPADVGGLTASGGKVALVQVQLRGDPTKADEHVAGVERVVNRVAHHSPGTTIGEAGPGAIGHAITDIVSNDLGHAELLSLPITLLILVLAFGALVAAAVPLLLGLTSVAGALGALGVVSQIAPSATATSSVVVLIGLAVGIDYSLFYIRREREERRAGAGPEAALSAAAATVGRAILVAGLTVVIALAGMLFSGLAVFTSIALASIVVVLIAVTGSVTVLPAVLALLGDRIDRGRLLRGRLAPRNRAGASRVWTALARVVTRHPVAALVTSVCALGALTVPVIGMRLANPGDTDLPANTPVLATEHAIEHWFPGAPDTVTLVATGQGLHSQRALDGLSELGRRARTIAAGHGNVRVSVARNGRTAVVNVPSPTLRLSAERRMVDALRSRLEPQAASVLGAGARVQVTGDAAFDADFTHQLATATPLVIGFVLALAFVLLLLTFGSPRLALSVIGLNLLSVGAAFGLLVAVFQHHWAQSVLGFTSNGAIVSWLPLFAFVILFGLSMDYTVLVLERVREAQRAGDDARTAVTRAVGATGSTVTSAALVMVAVFAVFATLRLLEFKQLGFGLAAAIALDATIVRGIALPAAVTLLGRSSARGGRASGAQVPVPTSPRRAPRARIQTDAART